MKYKIENNSIVIQGMLKMERIEVSRVTRIVLGKKIIFYEDNFKLFSHRFCKELSILSDILFDEYYCEEVEYREPGLKFWRRILNKQFEEEVETKQKILDNILWEYEGIFDFDLCREIIINSEKRAACFKIWGENNGKQILLTDGKKDMQLCIFVPMIAPVRLYKNENENILAVCDECDMVLHHNMNNVKKYIQKGQLWRKDF